MIFLQNILRKIPMSRILTRNYFKIVEVSPRDGLQNISNFVPTENKKKIIKNLVQLGLKDIEVTSFVSKQKVPQMADAEEIINYCHKLNIKYPDVNFIALTPNKVGYNKAIECGAKNLAIFTAVSETFCKKNIGCSIDESLDRYRDICLNSPDDIKIRGYLSCIAGCPYEGNINIDNIVRVTKELFNMGCYEISLGDTIGVGTPQQISYILDEILKYIPKEIIAVHFHDTNGNAISNINVAIEKGIKIIDSSIAGIGGCPCAPGAPGNVATEDVLKLFEKKKIETHIDLNNTNKLIGYINNLIN